MPDYSKSKNKFEVMFDMDSEISDNTNVVLSMKIVGTYCTSCVAVLTKSLLAHEGIHSVKVSPQFDEVRVEYSAHTFDRDEIERLIQSTVKDSIISDPSETPENVDAQTGDTELHTAIDPVCHMKVHVDDDTLNSDFKENRYFFCAKTCKIAFEEGPELYLSSEGEVK